MNEKELKRWRVDKAEKLRYRYALSNSDIVIDLGVYKGDWINGINKYKPIIYGFEPIYEYFEPARDRFKGHRNIRLFNFAAGGSNRTDNISVSKDASSIYDNSGKQTQIKVKAINNIWHMLNDPFVALIKMNIEGAEFEVLESAIASGLHVDMGNIQVQFHNIPGIDAVNRRDNIREQLSKTHHLTYDYEFVWENWQLNK